MTDELFRDDAYLRTCEATVTAVHEHGLELDRTVFYPTGGGQPGDQGVLVTAEGAEIAVVDTRKGEEGGQILHVTAEPAPDRLIGERVEARIDWTRRHRLMRVHTTLHLLCSLVPAGVTGGAIRDDGTGRLDFDMPESLLDKALLTDGLNRLVSEDHPVSSRWITEAELDASEDLVRTMSVAPPRDQGRVRLMEVDGVDLQACGGTHVAMTGEIGELRVRKIEKKGKHNRRVNVQLVVP